MADRNITVELIEKKIIDVDIADKEIITANFTTIDRISKTYLSKLLDINFSNLQDEDILRYDITLEKWVNVPFPELVDNLSDLNDVEVSSPTNGQVLTLEDGIWKNKPIVEAELEKLVANETPTKITAKRFQTANNFVASSLKVYFNGLRETDITIINDNTFELPIDAEQIVIDPNVKLLLHLNGSDGDTSTSDSSASNHPISFNGTAQLDTAQKKFGSSSLLLDGNSDFLTIPDSPSFDICGSNTDDWTLGFFLKLSSLPIHGIMIINQSGNNNTDRWSLEVGGGTGFRKLRFALKVGGTVIIDTGFAEGLNDLNTHYITLCKVGNKYAIYLDGQQINYVQSNNTGTFNEFLNIGYHPNLGRYVPGWMDEILLINSNIFNASPNVGLTDTITVPTSEHNPVTIITDKVEVDYIKQ